MKKIVVTGAAGFIGSYCLDILKKKGYMIYAFSRKKRKSTDNLFWIELDLFHLLEVRKALEEIQATWLLHLAWETTPTVFYESDLNNQWYDSSVNLVDSFLANGGKKVVVAGSCAEYDWDCKQLNESSALLPQSLYGKCKVKLCNTLEELCLRARADLAWGRVFNVYGPGEPPEKIISFIIRAVLSNNKVECLAKDDIRDFIFVQDVANIFVFLLEEQCRGIFNVSTGKGTAIGTVAQCIQEKLNVSDICSFKQCRSLYPCVIGDNRKLRGLNYGRDMVELESGLNESIKCLLRQINTKKEAYNDQGTNDHNSHPSV